MCCSELSLLRLVYYLLHKIESKNVTVLYRNLKLILSYTLFLFSSNSTNFRRILSCFRNESVDPSLNSSRHSYTLPVKYCVISYYHKNPIVKILMRDYIFSDV